MGSCEIKCVTYRLKPISFLLDCPHSPSFTGINSVVLPYLMSDALSLNVAFFTR